ncbi:periplasmic heavy metal sensor [Asticcacaulis sp.]|uniref:periplasmic heavy metal sensor n=1 Tax=Asticcacaulis sp. TaxID=1872648 RepID=UPI002CD16E8C|nr:periplasmic heavy metal sensor [Asticcacaulis sp.]HTM79665.1 periplasmic heavy metal sensor [Asticcacaulis sp.]
MGSWLTETRLKWIVAVSLIVNIFLIGAAIGAGFVVKHHLRDLQRPMAMQKAWRAATEGTTKAERHHIYLLTKAAALTGEADMAKARDLRAQARVLVSQEPYDAAQIAMLSEQARSAENDARGKIENALILNMKDLPVRERAFMLTTLLRASGRFDRFIEKDDKPPVAVGATAK